MVREGAGCRVCGGVCSPVCIRLSAGESVGLLAEALGLEYRVLDAVLLDAVEHHHGSLRMAVNQLLAGGVKLPGVGPARLRRLAATLHLGSRLALEELVQLPVMTSPESCTAFLRQHFALHRREVFSCLFLDTRNRLLACRDLFVGTIDGAAVYPREVVAEALRQGATGVIAAHNHPSGSAVPSAADVRITERLRAALALLDIRLLDHLIVGHGQVYSMARHGDAGF